MDEPDASLRMLNEIIIKVDNRAVRLSRDLSIPIEQTNIPWEHMTFRDRDDIFWKVSLEEYNAETRCWRVKVVDYFTEDSNTFHRQKSTKPVERIAFEKFEWHFFEPLLSSYQRSKLMDVLENHDTRRLFYEPIGSEPPRKNKLIFESEKQSVITTNFSVPFSDLQFKLGYVTFGKEVDEVDEHVDFKIPNDTVLPEFDSIKPWFAKKLKTKKIKVTATLTVKNSQVINVVAKSLQIDQINDDLIDSIRYQRTLALTRSPIVKDIDKSLFSTDDIFGEFDSDDQAGNVFDQSEEEILKFLVDNPNIRNRKQLEYLAGQKHSKQRKLRFTLSPLFGFLFLIEGRECNHFAWELLNSHATYLWSIGKTDMDLDLQFRRIEDTINTIRNNGRDSYKQAYRQHHHDDDLTFCSISHDGINSDLVDGFAKWKHRLNEKLI